MKICSNCGMMLSDSQMTCTSCGTQNQTSSTSYATKSALEQFNPIKTGAYYDKLFAKMETTVSAADLQDKQALIAARDAQEAEKHRLYLESQKAYVERQNSLSENYFLGFIGALLGSLVGAVPWALVSSAGWFVAWLGYVIAIAASKGYDLMNVKATRKKIPCVAVAK